MKKLTETSRLSDRIRQIPKCVIPIKDLQNGPPFEWRFTGGSMVARQISRNMRFPTMWHVRPAKPRSACAYAQSDQSLCLSLGYSMSVKLLPKHGLEFLSLNGGCTGSSESTLVKMSQCWESHVTAQMAFH